jgi:hypothetical protein
MTQPEIDAMLAGLPRICVLVPVPSGRAILDCRMMQTRPLKGRGETLAFVPVGLVVQLAS